MESVNTTSQNEHLSEVTLNDDSLKQDLHKLNSAVWTTHATAVLLKLYEAKLEMLETPKKKTRIWIAISDSLRSYNIDVTPDQVRWKINALTKKYKHCIDLGKPEKFKYFKEINNIYAKYNVDCDSFSIKEFLSKNKLNEMTEASRTKKYAPETKAMIEIRKARLAKRIDCDRFQGKIKLERQWLQYLHRQEEEKQLKNKALEKYLKLREENLKIRKRDLEMKESLEYRKLQIIEKAQTEMLQVEREKCELLKHMLQL